MNEWRMELLRREYGMCFFFTVHHSQPIYLINGEGRNTNAGLDQVWPSAINAYGLWTISIQVYAIINHIVSWIVCFQREA